jgi:hypothetical protein
VQWTLVSRARERSSEERHELTGYTDADGATQDHRRAISGYVFLIDGAAVSRSSRKQELVTLSTSFLLNGKTTDEFERSRVDWGSYRLYKCERDNGSDARLYF